MSKKKWYPKAHSLRRYWGRALMFVSGLRGQTIYEEPLNKKQTYIFTPNHFSYFDIVSVNSQMPFFFSFMAKKELANIPFFKIFFRTIDLPVDRKSIEGAKKAYYLAHKKLKDGISLLNFPEGGIGTTVPKMRNFKMGPFKLAIEYGHPIVPITLPDNWKRLPSGGLQEGGTPGKMRMYVHRPIPTENLKPGDEVELAKKVYTIIEEKFNELNGL
ncbi:MAG: 1-acyl-sn-glycerol-3-phosphate acyltransferase [Bacteroidia bacterium]|nr:1-acyl-sn-glycerol-3-phosphate acyltransferase [Bacteroidia bacterium]